jgi:hypothetical protein
MRLAVYHDSHTLCVQATSDSALETQSLHCINPTTSVFTLLHIIGELFKATKTGTPAASEQPSVLGPAVCFGSKIFCMRWACDDPEVVVREREVDGDLNLELVDDT